jgi:hypothetical protein
VAVDAGNFGEPGDGLIIELAGAETPRPVSFLRARRRSCPGRLHITSTRSQPWRASMGVNSATVIGAANMSATRDR